MDGNGHLLNCVDNTWSNSQRSMAAALNMETMKFAEFGTKL